MLLSLRLMLTRVKPVHIFVVGVWLLGLFIRVMRIWSELVWADEVFYLTIAKTKSLGDILFVRHWIIDHPQLYMAFQHFWTIASTKEWWLRLPNLFFYSTSVLVLWKLSGLIFKSVYARVLLVMFYSILPYYIGLDWQAIPYTFTFGFFLISFYFLVRQLFGDKGWAMKLFYILGTTSFLYSSFEGIFYVMGVFVFLVIGGWVLKIVNLEKVMSLIIQSSVSAVLFLPEVVIVLKRIGEMPQVAKHLIGSEFSFIEFFYFTLTAQRLDLRSGWLVVTVLVVLCFLALILSKRWAKKEKVGFTLMLSLFGVGVLMIEVISKYFYMIKQPKSYYYLIMLAVVLAMVLIERYWRRIHVWVSVVLLLMVGGYLKEIRSGESEWITAGYFYDTAYINPYQARDAVIHLLSEGDMRVVIGYGTGSGGDEKYVPISDYYFKCFDLNERTLCNDLDEHVIDRRKVDQLDLNMGVIWLVDEKDYARIVGASCLRRECVFVR